MRSLAESFSLDGVVIERVDFTQRPGHYFARDVFEFAHVEVLELLVTRFEDFVERGSSDGLENFAVNFFGALHALFGDVFAQSEQSFGPAAKETTHQGARSNGPGFFVTGEQRIAHESSACYNEPCDCSGFDGLHETFSGERLLEGYGSSAAA